MHPYLSYFSALLATGYAIESFVYTRRKDHQKAVRAEIRMFGFLVVSFLYTILDRLPPIH